LIFSKSEPGAPAQESLYFSTVQAYISLNSLDYSAGLAYRQYPEPYGSKVERFFAIESAI
jgi:hypothetical protein